MFKKILPVLFLLFGIGGGISVGLFLPQSDSPTSGARPHDDGNQHENEMESLSSEEDAHGISIGSSASEFVRMSNQFVIPVIMNDRIAALVVVSLSLETRSGASEEIYAREPKLRDAFLRVMFDHANMGGFHGSFTNAETMDLLRTGLREVAKKEMGPKILDVLIVDIIRQDT